MDLPRGFPDDETLKKEGSDLLGDLIRFNTTNPPGNEKACAEHLAKWLGGRGISGRVIESAPGRGSMVARVKGKASEEPLLLLSHLDVVPAVASDWSVPPFSGEMKDGYVWGRGAVDCKGPATMEALALAGLKQAGVELKRDVIFAATADEETGGEEGVMWLMENRRDDFFAPYALNEGGGFAIKAGQKTYFTCQTAEKKICWINLFSKGEPGHASMPDEESAMNNMSKALAKLASHRAPVNADSRDAVAAMWKLVAGRTGAILARLATYPVIGDWLTSLIGNQATRRMIKAMLSNTIAITVVHGGEKANVIPAKVEATIDCRLLPGMTHEEMLNDIRKVVGKFGVTAELSTKSDGGYSDSDTDLYRTIESAVHSIGPEYRLAPIMSTGATDGRYLAANGCKVYGFIPIKPEKGAGATLRSMHGIDERISVEALAFGAKLLAQIIMRF